jgi:hypothetical protein
MSWKLVLVTFVLVAVAAVAALALRGSDEEKLDDTAAPSNVTEDAERDPAASVADSSSTSTPSEPVFVPPFEFSEKYHDFGVVAQNTTQSYTFTLKNFTDREIEVTRIKVACNCLHVKIEGALEDDKKIFQPGETGVLGVTITTGEKTGEFSGTLKVFTREDMSRAMLLQVSGDVAAQPE